MFSKANLWIALFAIFTTSVIRAENLPTIEHLTTNNGLSHNSVNCMLQDRTGFIWLGSMNGLNRYDGIRIKNLSIQTGDISSHSSGSINLLHQDSYGHIWVKTYAGNIQCYDSAGFVSVATAHPSATPAQ